MRRIAAAAAVTVAVFAAAGCGGSDDSSSNADTETTATETTVQSGGSALTGSVGPGFEISMAESEVTPGTYTLTVDDQSSSHNFHLTGPGVDVSTDVGSTGTKTFTVDLQAGTYTFVCDPHSSQMNGTLTVG
jgi:plastocyanin